MPHNQPIRDGELNASTAVKFFDNICNEQGVKLVKSEKRAYLKEEMAKLYYLHPDKNVCHLADGRVVPIVVCRQNPGRGAFCYFNNIDAPLTEILAAFAKVTGITYKQNHVEPKKKGELIATDAKQFLDDICESGRKLAGAEKLKKIHLLFNELYHQPQQNRCQTPEGIRPIIVARCGENNHFALCLNTSSYRQEIFKSFCKWAHCSYLQDKENADVLQPKQKDELTARTCARIFHDVANPHGGYIHQDCSPKLVEWFTVIANSSHLNQVNLPDGKVIPLVVARKSHSQSCYCLNTSDEIAKPFVIWKVAQITKAKICLKNIPLSQKNTKQTYKAMKTLIKQCTKAKSNGSEQQFYKNYADMLFNKLNISSELTLSAWLKNKKQK